MAEAIAQYDAADVIEPSSAGLSALGRVAEMTKEVLISNGYPANGLTSDNLTREAIDVADLIVNMTGRPGGGTFHGHEKVEDWFVEDPYGEDTETYQRVFEGIRRRVNQLAVSLREQGQSHKAAG